VVRALSIAAANVLDLEVVPEVVEGAIGPVTGDRHYWAPKLTAALAPAGITLAAPFKKHASDPDPEGSRVLTRLRWRIETVAAQLPPQTHLGPRRLAPDQPGAAQSPHPHDRRLPVLGTRPLAPLLRQARGRTWRHNLRIALIAGSSYTPRRVGGAKTGEDVTENAGSAGPGRQGGPSLSLVIPAYNEAARIEATIREARRWLAAQPYPTELIVVDDGSEDGTADLAARALAADSAGRLLRLPHGGKAAAVRAGMLAADCAQIAFCDADLATPLAYLHELRAALAQGCDLAIGSREGEGARRLGEPAYRHLMGRVFNALVRTLLVPGIQDTQCGFKLFWREVGRDLLARSRLYRDGAGAISGPRVTAFDVEVLTVARARGYRVCPVPVVWTYGSGSKVRPARDTWHNAWDVVQVWWHAKRGRYRGAEGGRRKAEGGRAG
jgi:hypothetical protein